MFVSVSAGQASFAEFLHLGRSKSRHANICEPYEPCRFRNMFQKCLLSLSQASTQPRTSLPKFLGRKYSFAMEKYELACSSLKTVISGTGNYTTRRLYGSCRNSRQSHRFMGCAFSHYNQRNFYSIHVFLLIFFAWRRTSRFRKIFAHFENIFRHGQR